MSEYTIDDATGAADSAGEEGKASPPPPDDVKEISRQLKELQDGLKEERAARQKAEEKSTFWYERAIQRLESKPEAKAEPAAATDDDDDLELDGDILDLVSERNTKPIAKAVKKLVDRELKKRKVASVDDIDQKIKTTTDHIAEQQNFIGKIMRENPDLNDEQSDLSKAMTAHVLAIQKDSRYQHFGPADVAEFALARAKAELASRPDDSARRQRIAAQQGQTGRKVAPATGPALNPEVEAAKQRIIQGFGMTEEQYNKMAPTTSTWRSR